jgi:hypothetical protein
MRTEQHFSRRSNGRRRDWRSPALHAGARGTPGNAPLDVSWRCEAARLAGCMVRLSDCGATQ